MMKKLGSSSSTPLSSVSWLLVLNIVSLAFSINRLSIFISGLDLCSGRYDTPQHHLYRDMDTIFADDYSNPSLEHKGENGPRQPWHDHHCRIEGPSSYDVLTNIEQRWRKAITSSKIRKLFKRPKGSCLEDALIEVRKDDLITSPSTTVPHDHLEQWHV
ncbi:phospholipase d delta [Phtheirospermum japonicum]|uniref:Phospholipase d delta n=1 Tax=Phtheirospermum japonicum TaxID=374723 RepID=A0A830D7Y6_9LAMI|nr:phospholipase d delta [Phtheirospermum japonicum]